MSPNLRFYGTTTVFLYQVHWHQHARGGLLGGAMHDLYGEATNKTGGRVWIALYVKKQLKVIFNNVDVNVLDTSDTFFNVNDLIKDKWKKMMIMKKI
jgi:hypothetical protein